MLSIRSIKCPICDTEFVYNSMSLYKMLVRGRVYRVCGYKCYRVMQTMKESGHLEELHALLVSKTGGNKDENNSSEGEN